MEGNFRKILALVDYSEASLHAAEEAALIASKFKSELHLLHISSKQQSESLIIPGMPFFENPDKEEDEYYNKLDQLQKLKRILHKRYGTEVSCFEGKGNFIDVIRSHLKDFAIDLVVIGAKKRYWLKEIFSESKARTVIRSVGCEVLCVYSDSRTETVKKIVLPVDKSIQKRKIGIAYELARKFAAQIHLITVNKQEKFSNDSSTEALVASYRFLRDITNIPIECSTVSGKNLKDAAIHYANVIQADLILVDGGKESDVKKKTLWAPKIVNHSKVPVLSVYTINNRSRA